MTVSSNNNPAGHNGVAGGVPVISPGSGTFPELCARIHKRVYGFLGEETKDERVRNVQEQTRISLGVLSEAFDRYNISELSLSFNGGKDCLVLLILYLAALHQNRLTRPNADHDALSTVQAVYIQSPHPFNEVESFVEASVAAYSLTLASYNAPMKAAFSAYLQDEPSVKAIFVGTRRTDPHGGNLTHFDRTDHGWPDFMRIHPVIDWHYAEIWTFLRNLEIPYCSLYDQGYTSLGGTTDTHPNPALKKSTLAADHASFRPAYELIEDGQERKGRDR